MSMSLRDQLLQAGLINEKPPEKTSQERRQASKNKAALIAEQKLAAQKVQAEKAARDHALNLQQQDRAGKKARHAQVKQLIEQNRLPKIDSDEFYNFIIGKKVRRITVDAQRREQLGRGSLMIVRYEGYYDVVPAAIAERIRERDEHAVVPFRAAEETVDKDDPYKDYVVPDDLMW